MDDFEALNAIADFLDRLDGQPGGAMQQDLRRIATDQLRRSVQWVELDDRTVRLDDIESFQHKPDGLVCVRTCSGNEFTVALTRDELRELLS